MSDATTGKKSGISASENRTDWERLRDMSEEEIMAGIADDPDAVPGDEAFWRTAHVVMPQNKETITIRLDSDVLDWFRRQGKGYQTRINAVLRSYVKAHT